MASSSAAPHSVVRIQKEYKEVREAKDNSGITAELVDNQFTHWKGSIKGPEGTPYQGGIFVSLAAASSASVDHHIIEPDSDGVDVDVDVDVDAILQLLLSSDVILLLCSVLIRLWTFRFRRTIHSSHQR